MNNSGYVYFVGNESNGIKIGFSKNPEKRLKQLQTGNSDKLELLYIVNGSRDAEKFYHKYFSDVYKIRGEWYDYKFVMKWINKDKIEKELLRKLEYIK